MKILRRNSLKPGLGPLSVIAIILLVSGVLRFVGGTGQAIAKEVSELAQQGEFQSSDENCTPPPDIAAVLAALNEKEVALEERQAYIAKRSVALSDAEKEIAAQIATLEQAELALEETLSRADIAAEDDVARLTAVYENMKAKEAARLFEAMAPEFAAGFLGRMRPDSAAKVVEGMSAEAANVISVILAGRNANAPGE